MILQKILLDSVDSAPFCAKSYKSARKNEFYEREKHSLDLLIMKKHDMSNHSLPDRIAASIRVGNRVVFMALVEVVNTILVESFVALTSNSFSTVLMVTTINPLNQSHQATGLRGLGVTFGVNLHRIGDTHVACFPDFQLQLIPWKVFRCRRERERAK